RVSAIYGSGCPAPDPDGCVVASWVVQPAVRSVRLVLGRDCRATVTPSYPSMRQPDRSPHGDAWRHRVRFANPGHTLVPGSGLRSASAVPPALIAPRAVLRIAADAVLKTSQNAPQCPSWWQFPGRFLQEQSRPRYGE